MFEIEPSKSVRAAIAKHSPVIQPQPTIPRRVSCVQKMNTRVSGSSRLSLYWEWGFGAWGRIWPTRSGRNLSSHNWCELYAVVLWFFWVYFCCFSTTTKSLSSRCANMTRSNSLLRFSIFVIWGRHGFGLFAIDFGDVATLICTAIELLSLLSVYIYLLCVKQESEINMKLMVNSFCAIGYCECHQLIELMMWNKIRSVMFTVLCDSHFHCDSHFRVSILFILHFCFVRIEWVRTNEVLLPRTSSFYIYEFVCVVWI